MTKRWLIGFLMFAIFAVSIAYVPHLAAQTNTRNAGQVALIGSDQNVYVYDVATDTITAITDDAERGLSYTWPTWSWDGQLAYFGSSQLEVDRYDLGIFVKPDPQDTTTYVHKTDRDTFTYASWSPADCPAGSCRDLLVLYTSSDRGTLAVRRMRSQANDFVVDDIAEGQPFYWDWSPDGQSMLWTRFGRTLEIYDVASDEVITELEVQPGFQRSVDWSPVDDRLLSTVRNVNRRSDLVVFDGDTRQILAESLRGNISFQWSPDGTQVAYLEELTGELAIVDAMTGALVAQPSTEVVMFQWSPSGDRLAYATIGRAGDNTFARPSGQGDAFLIWNVYELDSRLNIQVATFVPTQEMIYFLRFFDQFTRSHSMWSPDGRFLVYAELLADDNLQVVKIVDVTDTDPRPEVISEGSIGIFSWQ
jgi:hypothetical protein